MPPRPFLHLAILLSFAASARGQTPREPDPPCRADYVIQVRYEEEGRRLIGTELVRWHNRSSDDVPDLWFHLYWNAFANNRTTHLQESGGELRGVPLSDEWGWQRVRSIQIGEKERVQDLQWRPVDDGRAEDKTVFSLKLDRPAQPDEVLTLRIEWEARIPRVRRRTGYKDDFLFIAHWFPQLGVYEGGSGWNCHQFHANTEFFSDYGVYDVELDLPEKYAGRIGASGKQVEPERIADGRVRARFVAPSIDDQRTVDSTGKTPLVHGFTWTADPKFVKREFRFRYDDWARRHEAEVDRVALALGRSKGEVALRDVDVTVLLQPEHAGQDLRHFEATSTALFFYGLWFGGYPYEHITCVDPAWGGGAAGGMEYPTLFTAGTRMHTWPRMHSPESVTVHECGHQFWYGLVGNNEFEAAWMDEGFNTFSQNEAMVLHYGPSARTTEFAGLHFDGAAVAREPGGSALADALALKRLSLAGVELQPLPSSGVLDAWRMQPLLAFAHGENDPRWSDRSGYLADPDSDPVDTFGWKYVDSTSYRQNSYRRTAVNLRTLKGMVGEERFLRGMRLYSERWRYGHPYADDFFDAFCEGAQADAREYFEQAFRSTATVDWRVEVRQRRASDRDGWFLDDAGEWRRLEKAERPKAKGWVSEVVVRRKGVLLLPLKLAVVYEGGATETFMWTVDEQRHSTWWKPLGSGRVLERKVVSAVLDPERVYYLDLDMSNNQWHEASSTATPLRWSERVWTQFSQLLHWIGGIGG